MSQHQSFTEGKIYSPLVKFMLPLLGALFLQALYGAGDLLIIGYFCEASDISAVSIGTSVIDIIRSVASSLAIGVTIIIAQQIGAENTRNAGKVMGTGVWFFSILGLFLTMVLILPAGIWAELMNAPLEAYSKTVTYIRICATGALFVAWYNLLCAVFRGLGDSKTPLIIVSITFFLNFIADIFLVGYLKMGVTGSALTNVFAQGLSVIIAVLIIKVQHLPFRFDRSMIRYEKEELRAILRVGSPVVLQDLLVSFSFLVLGAIVNSLGLVASAGVGVAERVCAFIMLVPVAFEQALAAFVGQNVGARKPERSRKGLRYCIMTSLIVGLVFAWFTYFHGDIMAGIFANGKPEVIQAAAEYLRAYAIDCLLVCFLFCSNGYFSGLGLTKFVMLNGIVGAFCVRIPVSFIMSHIEPVSLFRVGLSTPCSTVLQITMCLIYYRMVNRKGRSEVTGQR